jgi:2,3-bisphosphoglycerate-independent phosphoglycerate mutase
VKYIILLGDGMADHPLEVLGGRTPIEAAHTPAMDRVAALGVCGAFCPIPEGLPPGSDIGNLSVFGYNPNGAFRGRAPIEAANQGIALAADEVAFRCNLVTLEDGRMRDFTAGHISTDEAALLVASLNEALSADFPIVFHTGVSYRHLGIVRDSATASLDQLVALACTPPHDITDQEYASHLPQGPGADLLHALMRRSQEVLAGHPVNTARVDAGKLPAVSIWPWGQGKAPSMESYSNKFGITGAVVSAVDLVKGIGVCAGLEVLRVPGATGWIDTNYEGKITAGLDALQRHDFVYIHLEAPDETAHQGRVDLKVQAIEDFDARIVAPALDYLDAHPDTRILVCPDHFTLISTKTHAGGPVPFALCGAGVRPDAATRYSERAAAEGSILVAQGHTLTERMIRDQELDLTR